MTLQEDIFEQDRDDTLPGDTKATCQTLLLTISVKEKLFNETQRNTAKKLLQRLEGDRRRKCRTSNIGAEGVTGDEDTSAPASIRKELLIVSSKKKSRKSKGARKKAGDDEDSDSEEEKDQKKRRSRKGSEVDEDGFKVSLVLLFANQN